MAPKRSLDLADEAPKQKKVSRFSEETNHGPSQDPVQIEDDPLDLFMAQLAAEPKKKSRPIVAEPMPDEPRKQKKQRMTAEAFFSDDDDDMRTGGTALTDPFAVTKKAKKKDIPTVDHSKIKYEPFKKEFYIEPTELKAMTQQEAKELRFELDKIEVHGKEPIPRPVSNFAQCGLGIASLDVISKLGFNKPTAIQAQAIPVIMSGRDAIGIAKTGSGKTIAFLLPMFRHIKDQKPLGFMEGPVGLVVAPTRELATQIHKECKPWLKALNLRAMCAYGGAPISDQIAELKRGAEIIVCTPGRMIDLLAANGGRVTNLKRVTYCVLDEADRMFDMGFEPQINKILSNVRPDRQTVLFSATFPSKMDALSRKALTRPVQIIVGGTAKVAPEITQIVEVKKADSKFRRLLQMLGEVLSDTEALCLIFVERQETAEDLMALIMRHKWPCQSIHGGKDQYDRDTTIEDFKKGIFPVLVATSVAARGLDVKQLKLVVNYDCPNHMEDYVHRAGRTGRAGQTGIALTFITPEQGAFAGSIIKALKNSEVEIPEDLKKLAEDHATAVKDGKEKKAGGGFGGRGIGHLEEKRNKDKQVMRRVAGIEEEGAATEEGKEKEEPDKAMKMVQQLSGYKSADAQKNGTSNDGKFGNTYYAELDKGNVKAVRTEQEPSQKDKEQDKMAKVLAAANQLNSRLRKDNEVRGMPPVDNKGPDAGKFHTNFQINDLPQKARWAVTNRTNVAKVLEQHGVSITTKGHYYPNGEEPKEGDKPKLYILIEGDTDVAVSSAHNELIDLAAEGIRADQNAEARAPASGRYNVLK